MLNAKAILKSKLLPSSDLLKETNANGTANERIGAGGGVVKKKEVRRLIEDIKDKLCP